MSIDLVYSSYLTKFQSEGNLSKPTIWVDDHFCVPILPFVKLLISSLGICKRNSMGDHEAGLCFASNNHVSKVSVVRLDITLSSTKGKTLQKVR